MGNIWRGDVELVSLKKGAITVYFHNLGTNPVKAESENSGEKVNLEEPCLCVGGEDVG